MDSQAGRIAMKCLGLIGSVAAPVLDIYWHTIRNEARKTLGPDSMPEFMVNCVKTRELRARLDLSDWRGLTQELSAHGRSLAEGGADALIVCGSALNPAAATIHRSLGIPVIDLGYALLWKLRHLEVTNVGLLGVRSPQEEAMWYAALEGVRVQQPSATEREWILSCVDAALIGQPVAIDWKIASNRIVSRMRRSGATALILADPTLSSWIKPGESLLYPIDAAEIHAWIATLWALQASFLPAPSCVICDR